MNNLVGAAVSYGKRGWKVFPVKPNDKRPLIRGWNENCSSDEQVIRNWWAEQPNANIGLVTGSASGIFVIDVDNKGTPNGLETFANLERVFGQFKTLRSKTQSSGYHLLFLCPQERIKTKAGYLPGIDVRSDGGYIVAPPSAIEGRVYQWEDESAPILPAPSRLITTLKYGEAVLPPIGIAEGSRNEKIFGYCRNLHKLKLDPKTAEDFALLAAHLCNPPFPEDETILCLKSASDYVSPNTKKEANIICNRMDQIESKPISWLWEERFARGKVSLIAGTPGRGKSQLTISMASIVSTGALWPAGGPKAPMGNVIFLSAEDDAADTIRPRLIATNADLRNVYVLESVKEVRSEQIRGFNLKADINLLEETVASIGGAVMLVIDPITAYLDGVDSHKSAEIRGVMALLSNFAAQHNIAVICVTHLTKSTEGDVMHRVIGSQAFVAAARAVYAVADDKKSETPRRLLLPLKNNIGNDQKGYGFHIEERTVEEVLKTSCVVWHDKHVLVSAEEALSEVAESDSILDEAQSFLFDVLSQGPLSAQDVFKQTSEAGFSRATIRRAQRKIGIRPKKDFGDGGKWMWKLPESGREDDQDNQHAQQGELLLQKNGG